MWSKHGGEEIPGCLCAMKRTLSVCLSVCVSQPQQPTSHCSTAGASHRTDDDAHGIALISIALSPRAPHCSNFYDNFTRISICLLVDSPITSPLPLPSPSRSYLLYPSPPPHIAAIEVGYK